MSQEAIDVRRAIANYLADQGTLDALHEVVASAFSTIPIVDPDAAVVHHAYGLLTDQHAGLLGEDALRDALRPLVTSYFLVWSLMAEPIQVITESSDVFTPPTPVQRPSLRLFDRPHEAVSA